MTSRSDGALCEIFSNGGESACFELVADFYGAVIDVFGRAWVGMSPKTSRLVHGVGLVALGYVMDYAWIAESARTRTAFGRVVKRLAAPRGCLEHGHFRMITARGTVCKIRIQIFCY
jgi:hypothetical protein